VKTGMLNIGENEKIEIRHQSQGCFHHYEDVYEIFGNAPLEVQVYRLQPNSKTFELNIVEKRGTLTLTETDIEKLSDFIAQYRKIASQKDTPPPGMISTTEDTIRLIWFRDGEVIEEIRVHQEHEISLPILREIRSRAK
jgi:hypothetical protein